MRVTILGGGGFRVPLIVRQLAASVLPVSRVTLYDTDPARLAVIADVLRGDPVLSGDSGAGALPLAVVTELDAALHGADVIFSALRPGGLGGRVGDERAALALGVLGQETVGAGGLASAARTVPVVDAIARRIAELAPGAWVISMTNPAGIVTEVMAAVLGPRVIGVCDSPVGLIRRACAAAGVDPGPSLGAVTDRVDADYLGINHLGWLRALRVSGTDLLPALLHEPGRLRSTEEGRLFGADLLSSLGAIPNEYLYWYYAHDEALRAVLAAGRTRGEHVRERQQAFYAAAAGSAGPAGGGRADAAGLWQAANDERNRSYFAELRTGERAGERDEADVAAGGYESVAIALASALCGGPAARLILNVRNGDTVAALSPDTAIEVPCRVDAAGAVPLPVSAPSAHQLGLMAAVRSCERDIADAALLAAGPAHAARAGALALRAFAAHPLVGSLDAARSLAAAAIPAAEHAARCAAPGAYPHLPDLFQEPAVARARQRGMRSLSRYRWRPGRPRAAFRILAFSGCLTAVGLAGCTVVHAPSPHAHASRPVSGHGTTTGTGTGVTSASPPPSAGTPKQRAVADAGLMLKAFAPPAGAREMPGTPVPASTMSGSPATPTPVDDDVVTETSWWLAPGDPQQVLAWEKAHIPSPYRYSGAGTTARGVWNDVYSIPAVPGLFDERELAVSATAAGAGQTAIRVDALVDWIPARPAGDTVPATARVARLVETGSGSAGTPPRQHTTVIATATVTGPAQVAALAAYLNGLAVNPPGAVWSCPASFGDGTLTLTFSARPGGQVLAMASAELDGCAFLSYTMPGQPAVGLGDGFAGVSLLDELNHVTGLHWKVPVAAFPS